MMYRSNIIVGSILLTLFVGCSKSTQDKAGDAGRRATESQGDNGGESAESSEAALALNKYLSAVDAPSNVTYDSSASRNNAGITRLFRSERETASLKEIRQASPDQRATILSMAMNRAATNPAVELRLEDLTHAVVGLDRDMRKRIIDSEVQPRLNERDANDRTRTAAIRVGLFLNADAELPDFALTAARALLTATNHGGEGTLLRSQRLARLVEQLEADDFPDNVTLLAAILADSDFHFPNRRQLDTLLLNRLAQADPQRPISDHAAVLDWYLMRSIHNREKESEQERCLAYLCSAIQANPAAAQRLLADDEEGERREALARSPELLAALPEAVRQQLAAEEAAPFLEQLETPTTVRLELPALRMATYLAEDLKRKVASVIIHRMRSEQDQSNLGLLTHRLVPLAASLWPEECVDVFELIEPSPFGDEQEPEVSDYTYAELAKNVSPLAADAIGRWLFDKLRESATPTPHYGKALACVACNFRPETATKVVQFFSRNYQRSADRNNAAVIEAAGQVVPKTDADALANELMAKAIKEADGAIASSQLGIVGALSNADPRIRYRAFEMILERIDYAPDPAQVRSSSLSSGSREYLLSGSYTPALATVLSNLAPQERKKAFEAMMRILVGDRASLEAVALTTGLVAVAPHLSSDDARRAFEVIVRLNLGDPRQHRKMPQHLKLFVAARPPEEHSALVKVLLPGVIDGRFRIKTYPATGSDPVEVMNSVSKNLPAEHARDVLGVMFELLKAQEQTPNALLFYPVVERIPDEQHDAVGKDIVERMRSSAAHHSLYTVCLSRLRQAQDETFAAAVDEMLKSLEEYVAGLPDEKSPQIYPGRTQCGALGELLPRLDSASAQPRLERLVRLLCRIIYKSDTPPEHPQVVRFRERNLERVALEIGAILDKPRTDVSPATLDTILLCAAALYEDAHPVPRDKMLNAINLQVARMPEPRRSEARMRIEKLKLVRNGTTSLTHRLPDRKPQAPVSIEQLADPETRGKLLPRFFDSRRRMAWEERLSLLQQLDEKGYLVLSGGHSMEEYAIFWFSQFLPDDVDAKLLKELQQPDCVGLKGCLFAAALAMQRGRSHRTELWEMAEDLAGKDESPQ